MDGMGDGLSSPARWRRPPRRWVCIVLYGSTTRRPLFHGFTTGRPPWLPSRLGRRARVKEACRARDPLGWMDDAAMVREANV
jgi:hypothetical protein